MAKRVKWTTNKVNKVRRALKNGVKQKEIANMFKVSQSTISRIIESIEQEKAEKVLHKKVVKPVEVKEVEAMVENLTTVLKPLESIETPSGIKAKRGRPKKENLVEKAPSKKRGRPQKVADVAEKVLPQRPTLISKYLQAYPVANDNAMPSALDKAVKELGEAANLLNEAEKIIKQLESEVSTANLLLRKIGEMSWFQRKDCGKLIENYFQNHLA